jgi:hypothetical protein
MHARRWTTPSAQQHATAVGTHDDAGSVRGNRQLGVQEALHRRAAQRELVRGDRHEHTPVGRRGLDVRRGEHAVQQRLHNAHRCWGGSRRRGSSASASARSSSSCGSSSGRHWQAATHDRDATMHGQQRGTARHTSTQHSGDTDTRRCRSVAVTAARSTHRQGRRAVTPALTRLARCRRQTRLSGCWRQSGARPQPTAPPPGQARRTRRDARAFAR